MSELLRWSIAILIGAVMGWVGCAWYHGHLFSEDAAQEFVTAGIEADRAISAGELRVTDSVERVRTVVNTVKVAPDCPPGQGAISDEWADKMREVYK